MAAKSNRRQRRVSFKFNAQKAVEAILWIAEQRPGKVSLYQVVKVFFFGDLHHLNTYGRPITGDFYCALEHGPTPSNTYNILKGDELTCAPLGTLPFKTENTMIVASRPPNMDYLSASDIKALTIGWDTVKDKSFAEIRALSHSHKAYKKTWENRGSNADAINFSDLIDDAEKVKALREIAPFIKI